jgi:ComF family protein
MIKWIQSFLDFIYPPVCLLCDTRLEENTSLCPGCLEAFLDSMAVTSQRGRKDFHHLTGDIFFDEVVTFWDYTPETESLIHRVKYQRGKKLGVFLGSMAGRAFQDFFDHGKHDFLLPVPLHRARLRERGYNQSALVCRGMANHIPADVHEDVLRRHRHTATQTHLSAHDRQKNVRDAFAVHKGRLVDGKSILLVDDVVTTGATMNSCAFVLKQAGAHRVVGLALARPQFK